VGEKHQPEPLRVIQRTDYAVQVKEQLMEQPDEWFVVRGETIISIQPDEAAALAYIAENA
jgi:hypothetical protein